MPETEKHVLHFTIGPVQSFVGQARRTRDYWAGSFLLSWLAGQAMAGVIEQDGDIDFPVVSKSSPEGQAKPIITDPMLAAIMQRPIAGQDAPEIGSLPNRFRALVPADVDLSLVKKRVQEKWQLLAAQVWSTFFSGCQDQSANKSAKEIWDRQVASFWDIQWVVGPQSPSDGGWLDLRKNWRAHWGSVCEGGDHCTIMGDWQELSGFVRSRQADSQNTFWQAVQANEDVGRLELRDGERLCAISGIKRFFAKLNGEALVATIGWIPGGRKQAAGNWPSTAYMSALPWLIHLSQQDSTKQALFQYFDDVCEHLDKSTLALLCSERNSSFSMLDGVRIHSQSNCSVDDLDGNLFIEDALANARATPLSTQAAVDEKDPDEEVREKLLAALQNLHQTTETRATSFYAMLLLDGDQLGALLQDTQFKNEAVSAALARFTGEVKTIVEMHQGVTMYAGGDDVMAMLPITTAIQCGQKLAETYINCFKEEFGDGYDPKMTASVAIVISHFQNALQEVIRSAHHYLDDVAKDGNGRNSITIALSKPGGVTATWTSKLGEGVEQLLAFQKLVNEEQFSASFFYNLRQRYPMFQDDSQDSKFDVDFAKKILLAEFKKSRDSTASESAESNIETMLGACQPASQFGFQVDGALIARFISEQAINFRRSVQA